VVQGDLLRPLCRLFLVLASIAVAATPSLGQASAPDLFELSIDDLMNPILPASGHLPALTWAAPIAILVYHFVSLRRVFGGSRLTTAVEGTLLSIVYLFAIVSTMVAIGLLSVKGTGPGQTRSGVVAPEGRQH
jgi:hypothetical protein